MKARRVRRAEDAIPSEKKPTLNQLKNRFRDTMRSIGLKDNPEPKPSVEQKPTV